MHACTIAVGIPLCMDNGINKRIILVHTQIYTIHDCMGDSSYPCFYEYSLYHLYRYSNICEEMVMHACKCYLMVPIKVLNWYKFEFKNYMIVWVTVVILVSMNTEYIVIEVYTTCMNIRSTCEGLGTYAYNITVDIPLSMDNGMNVLECKGIDI